MVRFNPYSYEFHDDPFPVYRQLRDEAPSYHDDDYWGPVFRTLSEQNVVMCLHIGQGQCATGSYLPATRFSLLFRTLETCAAGRQ